MIVRLIMKSVRQDLIAPVRATMPIPQGPRGIFNAWEISHGFTDSSGHAIPGTVITACFNTHGELDPNCLARHHVFQSFVYEPANRFWSLQAAEAGIFLALSAAMVTLAVWWIRHRIA